ncbi:Asp23/Gls24 family envelope stress response protein, partial [Kitasatospora sp. NPDC007106]
MTRQAVAARERGATVIPDRVVARIAARAGREALAA